LYVDRIRSGHVDELSVTALTSSREYVCGGLRRERWLGGEGYYVAVGWASALAVVLGLLPTAEALAWRDAHRPEPGSRSDLKEDEWPNLHRTGRHRIRRG
jgi:hypothetical protein